MVDIKNFNKVLNSHSGMAHTRWATHGEPCARNSHPHKSDPKGEFAVVKELEGAYSFIFKSAKNLKVDFVDVEFGPSSQVPGPAGENKLPLLAVPSDTDVPNMQRSQSRAFLSEDDQPQPIEYFLASDPSAIVEHTRRVLYLEDDDIAHIGNGELHIHRLRRDDGISSTRSIQTLEIELAA